MLLARQHLWPASFHSARTYATALRPTHAIYVSTSTDPYFNLSLEDWLFRHAPHRAPLLLLYRDRPCVVFGRNQNPWKEVNLRAAREAGVPFIRRRSGGGTVYHDLGNTNFSIHLPRTSFDRHATAQVVLRAVCALGIDASVNDRNDICVGTYKMSARGRHVSGSAYKIVNNRAYHHGTMLLSTRLDLLGDLLRANKTTRQDTIHTKGVESVRSPVRNLQQFNPSIVHDEFVSAVVNAFREEYGVDEPICTVEEDEGTTGIEYIRTGMAELPSWDWAFGQTPEFTHTLQRTFQWGELTAEIHSKHGIILACALTTSGNVDPALKAQLEGLAGQLKEQKYAFVDEAALPSAVREQGPLRDMWQWLKDEMQS
ncbi:Lipoyltransferase and lipoate-protein ligase [Wolfiporia cocos MD-104 SS10]|uniref:Putative lipoate-protein ligase A n=1 Tax=Wolfiporia cocos (strain MD-104) TaxID=742152 RepID=A0A2H3JFI4_WOLCO|nr:Lipoyltransferase and lipoate-protein ligase [Wolfiporia cocos MD-104 SS10]